MIKKILFLIAFLFPLLIKAQYSHMLELNLEYKNSDRYQSFIDYPIMEPVLKNSRSWIISNTGSAITYAIAYRIKNIPLQILYKSSFVDYTQHSRQTYVLDKIDISELFKLKKYGLEIRYIFLDKSTLSPYISLGINKNFINYTAQRNINLYNIYDGIIEIKDSYVDNYYITFKTIGFSANAGIKLRMFDNFGFFTYFNYDFINENKIFPPQKHIYFASLNAGIYYRTFKRDKF